MASRRAREAKLRAAERIVERKAAKESHGNLGSNLKAVIGLSLKTLASGQLPVTTHIYQPVPRPCETSIPKPSAAKPIINGCEWVGHPSLDAFGKLTLESTIATASHSMYPDPESLENPNSIKNVNNLDNDCGDDCSAKLSDVFIDFTSDFGYGINGMTGRIDNREVNIGSDNVKHYWRYQGSPPFSSENIPGNTGSGSPVPSECEVHLSRLAQHLINQFTYPIHAHLNITPSCYRITYAKSRIIGTPTLIAIYSGLWIRLFLATAIFRTY